MNQNTAEQVARRIPAGIAFSKEFYKREDRSKFSNGMGVIPAHHEEDTLSNLHRLSQAVRATETEETYENCDGTTTHSIHPATNTGILTTIINDELFYSYLSMSQNDHHDELPSEAVSIDGMNVGQWLQHAQNNTDAIYFSRSSDWMARVI